MKLIIKLFRGIQLIAQDITGTSGTWLHSLTVADPYVKFTMGKQECSSSVKEKTLDPVWNEELTLYVNDPQKEILHFCIYEYFHFRILTKQHGQNNKR
jgi:Ca2+-dependent lipid-binding protein